MPTHQSSDYEERQVVRAVRWTTVYSLSRNRNNTGNGDGGGGGLWKKNEKIKARVFRYIWAFALNEWEWGWGTEGADGVDGGGHKPHGRICASQGHRRAHHHRGMPLCLAPF